MDPIEADSSQLIEGDRDMGDDEFVIEEEIDVLGDFSPIENSETDNLEDCCLEDSEIDEEELNRSPSVNSTCSSIQILGEWERNQEHLSNNIEMVTESRTSSSLLRQSPVLEKEMSEATSRSVFDPQVEVDHNASWEPIRSYLPLLVELNRWEPGLIKVIHEMAITYSDQLRRGNSSPSCGSFTRMLKMATHDYQSLKEDKAVQTEPSVLDKQVQTHPRTSFDNTPVFLAVTPEEPMECARPSTSKGNPGSFNPFFFHVNAHSNRNGRRKSSQCGGRTTCST